jgi:hypothetical protein
VKVGYSKAAKIGVLVKGKLKTRNQNNEINENNKIKKS